MKYTCTMMHDSNTYIVRIYKIRSETVDLDCIYVHTKLKKKSQGLEEPAQMFELEPSRYPPLTYKEYKLRRSYNSDFPRKF